MIIMIIMVTQYRFNYLLSLIKLLSNFFCCIYIAVKIVINIQGVFEVKFTNVKVKILVEKVLK